MLNAGVLRLPGRRGAVGQSGCYVLSWRPDWSLWLLLPEEKGVADGSLPVFLTCLTKCSCVVGWIGEGIETASLQKEKLFFFFPERLQNVSSPLTGTSLEKSLFWLWRCPTRVN